MPGSPARTVVVTGAATGIGRATALALAREADRVVAAHLKQPSEMAALVAEASAAGGEIVPFEADVTRPDDVEALAELACAGPPLAGWVNNAGISLIRPICETSLEDWRRVIDADLTSVFLGCRAAAPALRATPGGAIVNVASELGFSGRAHFSAYCAAKAGVIGLTRALARELAPEVRVNAVAPGPTWTPMIEAELATPGHEEPMDAIPLRRFATPEEIADTIVFLCSPRSTYYCGDVLSPNGGAVMR